VRALAVFAIRDRRDEHPPVVVGGVLMRRTFALFLGFALILQLGAPQTTRAAQSELRAFWVDAFGEGIFNEAEIDKLIGQTKLANFNTLVVQVGRRGDCFCNNAAMPRTQAAIAPLPYDPLQSLITKAHAAGIKVHAWIITTAIWNSVTPPLNPDHVFNLHGPSKTGADNWLMLRYDGANRAGADYLLDPGHPDAAEYIVRMYTSVAQNYDVDGLNFDRVRYPDQNLAAYPGVSAWGYNPVALARFQALTGRTDVPRPDDAQWMQWRRDQVTNIVRKVYVETYAIKPHIAMSADTITYSYGPATQGGWEQTRTYREVLQDWRRWMQEGILDLNIPMNYKREHFTTEPNNQRRMYVEWNEFARDHQYARQVAIGSAIYLNFVQGSVTQVRKALTPNANGNSAVGWVGYSYRTPDCYTNPLPASPECQPKRSGDASRAELIRGLTQPSEYDTVLPPVFSTPASVPAMPWKVAPTNGQLAVAVVTTTAAAVDQTMVEVRDPETDAVLRSRMTDGVGYAAFVDLAPGRYKVFVPDDARLTGKRVAFVDVAAGAVSRVTVSPFAKGHEGRRPPAAPLHPPFDPGEADLLPNGER
jgi:uncharacterized lipoprotein YddW (UPF0748 family)